jgi:hypothetical protein
VGASSFEYVIAMTTRGRKWSSGRGSGGELLPQCGLTGLVSRTSIGRLRQKPGTTTIGRYTKRLGPGRFGETDLSTLVASVFRSEDGGEFLR